jgi:ABC-2 type transport system permease protein
MRGLWMGHTLTGTTVDHEAWMAMSYCAVIFAVSVAMASWLFRNRTAT